MACSVSVVAQLPFRTSRTKWMFPGMMLCRLPLVLILLITACPGWVQACTDVLVTPEASADGSALIAYNADSGNLMGLLYHYPATNHSNTSSLPTKRPVYDWDSGVYLGTIPEAKVTYNVVGNVNEYGLAIGESTFGGVEILSTQTGAILDYGSLIYITLSRSKTCVEAIHTMAALMDKYGYASEGESFSLADSTTGQVWIMEVIGRGSTYTKRRGAVWVARRVPPGYVTAHANQARITTFPRDDPDNCLYAPDVVEVAIHYGLYSTEADPLEFSFSDIYCPVSFNTARLSEARVWSAFSQIADENGDFQQEYLDYATGRDFTSKRMPLWIKPFKPLSLMDLMHVMNSHYEGTELDMSIDVGAGVYGAPYRPRPLEWNIGSTKASQQQQLYHNERTIGVHQTGWNMIAQIRPHMPPHLGAITWFAVDDSSTSPRVPVYGSSRRISAAYGGKGPQDGVQQPLLQFDLTKAFWVQNMVSNFVYSRWVDSYPVLRNKIDAVQEKFIQEIETVDQNALEIFKGEGVEQSMEYVTGYSVEACDDLHKNWFQFYGELFVRFRDFFEIVPNPENPECGCEVKASGMPESWRKRIVDETGDHYKVLGEERIDTREQIKPFPTNKNQHLRDAAYAETLNLIKGYH